MTPWEEEELLRAALPKGHPDRPESVPGAPATDRDGLEALALLEVEAPNLDALERSLLQQIGAPSVQPRGVWVWGPVGLAVLALGILLVAIAKARAEAPSLWLEAGVGLLGAGTAAALGARTDATRLPGALLAAAGAALTLLRLDGWGWFPMIGLKCASFELASAAVACGVMALADRRDRRARSPGSWAVVAGAGALAALAALHLVCSMPGPLQHTVCFHLGAAALAPACALLWAQRARRTH